MKPSNFKRINKEDFPEESRGLVDRIGFSINVFAEEILNILNKKLTIKDNLLQDIVSINVVTDASGVPTVKTQFKNSLRVALEGIHIIRVENTVTPNNYPVAAVQIFFSENAGVISINKIVGLSAGIKYTIKMLTIGG